jgi:site-specific DNA-cytosine methylase
MNAQDRAVAEFFAGIGLMRIGLENACWRIALANDSACVNVNGRYAKLD